MASVETNIARLDAKITALSSTMRSVMGRVERSLLRDLEEASGRRETRKALKIAGDFDRELRAKGLNQLLDDISSLYGNVMSQIREAFADSEISFNFDKSELAGIEAMTQSDLSVISSRVDTYLTNVKSGVLRTTFAGGDTDQIAGILDTQRELMLRSINTDLINALQGFRNAITFAKTKDAGSGRMEFAGPKDKRNRPFCAKHVGKVYTLAQIQKMKNDSGGPALTEMGGFNCRHEWRPVKDEG